jgi:hypothetical protein
MKYSYNILIFICIIVLIVYLYFIFNKNTLKNGFQNFYTTKWSNDLLKRFNIYQFTVNKNVNQFNLDILQNQASPEEAEELIRTGYWPWPDDLKYLYMDKIWSSPIIKIDPNIALENARKVYNQNAMREILAWNSKEGQFLLYGADLGVSDGMPKDIHNTLKCSTDINGKSIMEKKIYTGMNLWNGYMNYTTSEVKPEDIPKEMSGFSFVNGPCNPCNALDSSGIFDCPFRINMKGDDSISLPWKQLWGLQ